MTVRVGDWVTFADVEQEHRTGQVVAVDQSESTVEVKCFATFHVVPFGDIEEFPTPDSEA